MSKPIPAKEESNKEKVLKFIELSELDTLYRDIYLERARGLMNPVLSSDAYFYIRDRIASLGVVEGQLRGVVQRGDWARTKELSERVKAIKKLKERGEDLKLGEAIYDKLAKIPIDPFEPGFNAFFERPVEKLNAMRARAIEILIELEESDPNERDFYSKRRSDLDQLVFKKQEKKKEEEEAVTEVDLRTAALNAVDAGDLTQLDDLLEKLEEQSKKKKPTDGDSAAVELAAQAELGDDLTYEFSPATLNAAKELGLAPVRTRSRRQFAYVVPYEWHPSFLKSESKRWAKDQFSRLSHSFVGTDKMREAIELYLFNPFINSGGTRYHVCLVVEDLLVEDFDEPEPRSRLEPSRLLDMLGLKSRWGLTRIEIENALVGKGNDVLRNELNLDPHKFKLVAIPPDIYTQLGQDRSWGRQEMWTHFDGYWIREGANLQALAGGDVRFGGTHDVVCFSPNYSSDKLLARFAVVQRKRMMSWPKR